ncbi:putative nuclease HARBI1 [Strongylocentrotus purpuratus]|uniref:DDE Tnp4 domain-containing protein n=1 Tax=Strongylocentrotus purpuratus TaxID=7668 RepID=A0A7M7N2Z9_STRPU|nr:putative nuclease HARBI1 [Strongylocentrotus purpuratus]
MAAANEGARRIVEDKIDPFEQLSDKKFKKKFRFYKEEVNKICGMLNEEDLDRKTARSKALTKELQNSRLAAKFEGGMLHGILLDDSGYPLLPWLMNPILNPKTPAENAYNTAHRKTRVIIEDVNGQIKNKFRCLLGHGMQIQPQRACPIITACCVLFNISKDLQKEAATGEDSDNDDGERQREEERCADNGHDVNREMDPTGIAARAEIVRTFKT